MSRRVVLKFGGSSLANIERIHQVARLVVQHAQNAQVMVVVSAMQGETDRLTGLAKSFQDLPEPCRELDQIIATGEVVSAAMLTMAIRIYGRKAQSMSGWQADIQTTAVNQSAEFVSMKKTPLLSLMDQNIIPIVTGFQGVCENKVTTLGRGGSDLTAMILSHIFKADACWIYTDVAGIYVVDPNRYANKQIFQHVDYDQLRQMAWFGAEVVQYAAVTYAQAQQVGFRVCSTFSPSEGTLVTQYHTKQHPTVVQKSGLSVIHWQHTPPNLTTVFDAVCMLYSNHTMVLNAPLHHVQHLIRQSDISETAYELMQKKTLISALDLTIEQQLQLQELVMPCNAQMIHSKAHNRMHVLVDDADANLVLRLLADCLDLVNQPA